MNTEIASIRALAEEVKVTTALAEKFLNCVHADPRRSSNPPDETRSSDPMAEPEDANPPSRH